MQSLQILYVNYLPKDLVGTNIIYYAEESCDYVQVGSVGSCLQKFPHHQNLRFIQHRSEYCSGELYNAFYR